MADLRIEVVEGLDGSKRRCVHFLRKGDDGVNRYVATVYNIDTQDLSKVRAVLADCILDCILSAVAEPGPSS